MRHAFLIIEIKIEDLEGGKSVKLWWFANVFWLVIFSILALIIGIRKLDGAGVVQTLELKVITFIILGVAFFFILIIQLIWFYFVRKRTKLS